METKQLIADHLRSQRESKELSPEQVAAKSGNNISASYLRRVERAVSSPSIEVLMTLCEVYGITPSGFFTAIASQQNGKRKTA